MPKLDKEQINAVIEAIRAGDINKAFKLVIGLKMNESLFLDFVALQARWRLLENDIEKGVVSDENIRLNQNQSISAFVGLLKQIDVAEEKISKAEPIKIEENVIKEKYNFSQKDLIDFRFEKAKSRHQRMVTFYIHLIQTGQLIKVTTPVGIPSGKLADELAKDIIQKTNDIDAKHFIFRLERKEKEILRVHDLLTAKLEDDEVLYLTCEFIHPNLVPEVKTIEVGPLNAVPATGIVKQGETFAAVGKGRRVLVDPKGKMKFKIIKPKKNN